MFLGAVEDGLLAVLYNGNDQVIWPPSNKALIDLQRPSYCVEEAGRVDEVGGLPSPFVPTLGAKGAHFAVFPRELPETYLLAGSPVDGVVLDPFSRAQSCLSQTFICRPVPQGFQKLDQFGIYLFSAGFYAAGLCQGSLMFHLVRAWLHCAPAHWIALTAIPQSPTDSAPLISPLLPALA